MLPAFAFPGLSGEVLKWTSFLNCSLIIINLLKCGHQWFQCIRIVVRLIITPVIHFNVSHLLEPIIKRILLELVSSLAYCCTEAKGQMPILLAFRCTQCSFSVSVSLSSSISN